MATRAVKGAGKPVGGHRERRPAPYEEQLRSIAKRRMKARVRSIGRGALTDFANKIERDLPWLHGYLNNPNSAGPHLNFDDSIKVATALDITLAEFTKLRETLSEDEERVLEVWHRIPVAKREDALKGLEVPAIPPKVWADMQRERAPLSAPAVPQEAPQTRRRKGAGGG